MSSLSRANLKVRESIFASGPEQYIGDTQARCPPDLLECVMAMQDCCEEVCVLTHFIPFPNHKSENENFMSRHAKRKF